MWLLVFILSVSVSGIKCDPETVRENFDYFSYGNNEDILRNLDLHMPQQEVVLRPQEVANYPQQSLNVGQITAVSINSLGQPVIFHRAERIWDESTFNESNVYQNVALGPIVEDTILVLDCHTGAVLDSWGAYAFFMPHGLTVDQHDNVWVTDVAKHQVFKYSPNNHKYPVITIGEAFTAGYPYRRRVLLCKPTSVAVASTGEFFVADGYCNNQILKFNEAGNLLLVIPTYADSLTLNLPHSIALLEHLDVVCVADRENMRIVCPKAGLKSFLKILEPAKVIDDPSLGRVFAIAAHGDNIYAVNGPTQDVDVKGFTINAIYGNIVDIWQPATGFTTPHSVAVTRNGSHLYVTEIGPNKIWKFEMVEIVEKRK